jgi:phosphoribosylformimino-5-aminoimidazole carboxamide ribotide isomerase
MRIIGVLDLTAGQAVHARAGIRESYTPVRQVGDTAVDGDAIELARVYTGQFGVDELYVADLDAIVNATPPHNVVHSVASLRVPVWLDAGVSSTHTAQLALAAGATRVIVGLETLSSFEALDDICRAIGGDRVAFSLDLRNGEPVALHGSIENIARRAADAGVSALTVIDLARVGMGSGPDLESIARVRTAVRELTLIAGGGVRGPGDLARLADEGCDGALVASALHDGRLTAVDVAAARDLHRSVSR